MQEEIKKDLQTNEGPVVETQGTHNSKAEQTSVQGTTFFPVATNVEYKPFQPPAERKAWYLPSSVARIVSAVGLGAALLMPLSSCGRPNEDCPPEATAKPQVSGTTPIKYMASNGAYFLWIPALGGWVPSDDGIHPNPGKLTVGTSGAAGIGTDCYNGG
uniref:Uncharacterized protein n=1 Tax=Thermosporothrix sp. COM3 TaxID=2490863 RepID=A0A455SH92_9CHLR|nr:hypothetical protein KTC_14420 [Thermosporothrix sp. COM3]